MGIEYARQRMVEPRRKRLARRTLVPILALGACGLASLPPAGAATQTSPPAAPLGGVNIGGFEAPSAQVDREMAEARALHATVVRTQVGWSELQPLGPDRFEARALAGIDHLVNAAAANGLRVIMMVDRTPCWASSAPRSLLSQCAPARPNRAGAWPPSNPASYAAFMAYLAQRYGAHLAGLEVWNEPDQANEIYFAGPHKVQRYAALLRAAFPAIKGANPQVPVLGGSLVGSNGVFLRGLYAAGIRGFYDGLSVHFYNLTLASLRSIHEVQLANGDAKPLWLDEFGWSSCWPGHRIQEEQACVTSQVQAANLTSTLRQIARTPYLAAALVYKLHDSPTEEFGLVSGSGAHKPAFSALAGVLLSPLRSVAPVTLSLRRQHARVLASGSAPVGDFMQLEALQGSTPRYRALFTLDRFNRYSIRLPSVLGTHGLTVRVFQYFAGQGRQAQKTI
jgi:hypothetical protein